MATLWFAILAVMLTTYAVLDGFDFGAGVVHFLVARTDEERGRVLAAIGPLWDGNEVWLIAAGGVFVFAFPGAYAAAFSGLYLPLTIVVWLVILRGLAIELRPQLEHPLWRHGFDVLFAGSSTVMAVVLGVALGNVVRGVPLDASGYFHEDLFGGGSGAIDPYTAATGVFAVATLAAHGATFLAWKTDGDLGRRAARLAVTCYRGLLGLLAVVTALTFLAVPAFVAPLAHRLWVWPLPLVSVAAALWVPRALRRGRPLEAFLASCSFIVGLLVATAATLYPNILRSTVADPFTLGIGSATGDHALSVGFALWLPGALIAAGYSAYVFRTFRGKAQTQAHG